MGNNIFSQDLEGEWKGSLNDEFSKSKIIFHFRKINDSTFEAKSITIYEGESTDTAICVLQGGFLKKNILLLEETRFLKPFSNSVDGCLQVMKLYYHKRKNYLLLKGEWYTEDNCGSGSIQLTKSLK